MDVWPQNLSMSSISNSKPVLRWLAAVCVVPALVLSWLSLWISVPIAEEIYAFGIFGLAVLGCVLLNYSRRSDSRADRQKGVIHAFLFLGAVLIPLRGEIPAVLRYISVACCAAALLGWAYTHYCQKNSVREEHRI